MTLIDIQSRKDKTFTNSGAKVKGLQSARINKLQRTPLFKLVFIDFIKHAPRPAFYILSKPVMVNSQH